MLFGDPLVYSRFPRSRTRTDAGVCRIDGVRRVIVRVLPDLLLSASSLPLGTEKEMMRLEDAADDFKS